MDPARYTFVSRFDERHLSVADKVNDLVHHCLAISWRFDAALATEGRKGWSSAFDRVVATLRTVQSDYVVPLSDAYEYNNAVYLVFPFLSTTQTLEQRRNEMGRMGEQEVRALLFDLLSGLRDLHAQGFYLGVIHPRSILRVELPGEGYRYMISDSGVSRVALRMCPDSFDDFVDQNGPYCAPEALFDIVLNEGTDLYLCAQLAYFALAGSHPLEGKKRGEAQEFYQDHVHLDCGIHGLPEVSAELSDWLQSILTFLPNRRLSSVGEALASLPLAEGPRESLSAGEISVSQREAMLHAPAAATTEVVSNTSQDLLVGETRPGLATAAALQPKQAPAMQRSQTFEALLTPNMPGPVSPSGSDPATPKESSKNRKHMLLWVLVPSVAVLLGIVLLVWISSAGDEELEGERELAVPGNGDDEHWISEDRNDDLMDSREGRFNLSRWKASAERLSPQLCSVDVVARGKPRTIAVNKANEMSYEFIAYCAEKSQQAWLLGSRGGKSCNAGIRFEQWKSKRRYGITWFGKVDATFNRAPTTYNKVVHLVFAFHPKYVFLYENGVFKGRIRSLGKIYGSEVGLGCCYMDETKRFSGLNMPGEIFGYAIYNRALSPAEVMRNFQAAVGGQ